MKSKRVVLILMTTLAILVSPARLMTLAAPAPVHGGRIGLHAARRGNPWVNLLDGRELAPVYADATGVTSTLTRGQVRPLSLTAADLDGDGALDLIAGYASKVGGVLAVHRGNVAYASSLGATEEAAFLAPARIFALPVAADVLGAGDFDADGHLDVVIGAKEDNALILLSGDGAGGLAPAEAIILPGAVTALTTGDVNRRDGLEDVIVGVRTSKGAQVLVFESPKGALRGEPEAFDLPAPATALALGQLDEDYPPDVAIAAGRDLLILSGRDRKLSLPAEWRAAMPPVNLRRYTQAFDVVSLALGDFVAGDAAQLEIALLAADGGLHLFERSGVEITAQTPFATHHGSRSARLLQAQISSLPADDLLVLDEINRQVQVLSADGRQMTPDGLMPSGAGSLLATLDAGAAPVAVLPVRLNGDALSDLVILAEGTAAPIVAPTAPEHTFLVVDDSDFEDQNPGDGQCDYVSSPDFAICTLRAAIQEANASPGADAINFSIQEFFRDDYGETDIPTISPDSALPEIIEAVTINGETDGWGDYVELEGSHLGPGASGLQVNGSNITIRGMLINRFRGNGISVLSSSNVIEGNRIGPDQAGGIGSGNEQGIVADSNNNTVEDNVIAANETYGVWLDGNNNTLSDNLMGVFPSGSGEQNLKNGTDGVYVTGDNNSIETNTISGNGGNGVTISDGGSQGNVVHDNMIGVGSDGETGIPNLESGVYVDGAPSNTISANVIGRNFRQGVHISGSSAGSNQVQDNYIGTNEDDDALGNLINGVKLDAGAHDNTIEGNTISCNDLDGIHIRGSSWQDTSHNLVEGNYIGSPAGDNPGMGNERDGVHIYDAGSNQVGSSGNYVRSQGRHGIYVGGPEAIGNELYDNVVKYSQDSGIFVDFEADQTTVGGEHQIQFNDVNGLMVKSSDNTVQGIHTTDNALYGVVIDGDENSVSEVIASSNDYYGVFLNGDDNDLLGSIIGLNEYGDTCLPNYLGGIHVTGTGNVIGGDTAAERNLISCNGLEGGVLIEGDTNYLWGNYIGTDVNGTDDLGNSGDNVLVSGNNNGIGGADADLGNIISGSDEGDGIEIRGDDNFIQANRIGVNKNGFAMGNFGHGIHINGGNDTLMGGIVGNTIAFNQTGVYVASGTDNRIHAPNVIHSNTALGIDLSPEGVTLNDTGDGDEGANHLQNYPLISSVVVSGTTTIQGGLNGQPNTNYDLQFYVNATCDDSGYGEGESLLAEASITTNSYGHAGFSISENTSVTGQYVVATAIDPDGNTSEFSQCKLAQVWGGGIIFTVNSTGDAVDTGLDGVCDSSPASGQQCTLRAAIQETNYLVGPNTIILPAGTYNLTLANAGGDEDAAATGDLDVNDDLTIVGDGAETTIINSTVADRVFEIDTNDVVVISGVTIQGGNTSNDGGGIYNDGALSLDAVSIQENDSGGYGGGIHSEDTLTVTNSAIISNTAENGGGGVRHYLSSANTFIQNTTLSGNQANGSGGGIWSVLGTTELNGVTIVGNTADANNAGGYDGGGLYYAGGTAFTVKNSLIAENYDLSQEGYPNGHADCYGTFDSAGYNTIGDRAYDGSTVGCQGFDATGDKVGGYELGAYYITYPAGVGPLRHNGGPTPNRAPLSPVFGVSVDLGNPATPGSGGDACGEFDQRGQPRTIDGDFDGAGRCDKGAVEYVPITLSAGDAGKNAEGGSAVFDLTLSASPQITASVYYSTSDGTAVAGLDYVSATGFITFPIGVTMRSVTVSLLEDTQDENDETLSLNLWAPYHVLLGDARGQAEIVDNDPTPELSIDDVRVTEGHSPNVAQAIFNVTLSRASGREVSVNYATVGGSAVMDDDYISQRGRLTFPEGTVTQAITIPIVGDDLDESNETFAVDLSDPINATLADKRGIGTITDDDTAALSIDDVARVEGDSGTTSMYFDVRLSASSVETITVDYATSDSAALAGSDYVAVRGTLTFPSGEMTRVITVTVLGDTVLEVDETFFVNLSDVINGTIADRQGRGTIMDDDGTRIYLPLVLQSS